MEYVVLHRLTFLEGNGRLLDPGKLSSYYDSNILDLVKS